MNINDIDDIKVRKLICDLDYKVKDTMKYQVNNIIRTNILRQEMKNMLEDAKHKNMIRDYDVSVIKSPSQTVCDIIIHPNAYLEKIDLNFIIK